jgi:hypothetical protein
MRQLLEELYWQNLRASAKGMSRASYALLAGMVVLLIAVAVMATLGWNAAAGTDIPPGRICGDGGRHSVLPRRRIRADGAGVLLQPRRL